MIGSHAHRAIKAREILKAREQAGNDNEFLVKQKKATDAYIREQRRLEMDKRAKDRAIALAPRMSDINAALKELNDHFSKLKESGEHAR